MKKLFFLLAAMTAILTSCGSSESKDSKLECVLQGFSEEQTPRIQELLKKGDSLVEPFEGYSQHPTGFKFAFNVECASDEDGYITHQNHIEIDLTYYSIMVAASGSNTKLDISAIMETAVVEDSYVIICNEIIDGNTLLYIYDKSDFSSLSFLYDSAYLNNLVDIIAKEFTQEQPREMHAMAGFISLLMAKAQEDYIASGSFQTEDGLKVRVTVPMKLNAK